MQYSQSRIPNPPPFDPFPQWPIHVVVLTFKAIIISAVMMLIIVSNYHYDYQVVG